MKNRKLSFAIGALAALALVLLMPAFIQAQTSTDQNLANPPEQTTGAGKETQERSTAVAKSYSLKYIDASEVYQRAQIFAYKIEIVGNVLNVVVPKNKVQELDELVKRMDVEKKSILFRIYTVLASRKAPNDPLLKNVPPMTDSIDDPGLKPVLDDLKGLWNFKSYRVDNPSFLTIKDGSGPNSMRLLANWPRFYLSIDHPQIRGEELGKRIIAIRQIQLKQAPDPSYTGEDTVIDAKDMILKEKGFLVVGVGGMPMVDAVILILSAEIK